METILGHIVDFVSANAAWAPYLAFVFAFGETLAFLSIVIPSTAILVAVGGLVATGSLSSSRSGSAPRSGRSAARPSPGGSACATARRC